MSSKKSKLLKVTLTGMVLTGGVTAGLTMGDVILNQPSHKVIAATKLQFKDVKTSYWAYSVIQWGVNNKVINGYPDGTFKPNNQVAESEFLAMLVRAYHPANFKEVTKKNHWADSYYLYSVMMNYPTAGAKDSSKRGNIINRAKVAEIIAGTQGVNYKGKDAIHYLLSKGLAKGKESNVTIDGYNGDDSLTRAEAVQFIKNVLDKGTKDKDGNPILSERPSKPSDPNDLKPLPGVPEKPEKPSESTIGSLTAKQLFDKTKSYANELGYKSAKFEYTYGQFTDKEGQVPAVTLFDTPGNDNANTMTFTMRNWNDEKNVKLFKKLIENYGVNSNSVIKEIDQLQVNSSKLKDGKRYNSQGKTFMIQKEKKNNNIQVTFVVSDW